MSLELVKSLEVELAVTRAETGVYRATLARIADEESGVWGHWARDALDAGRALREEAQLGR